MRRPRPIAIILIAAGIALWAGKNGELNRIIRRLQPTNNTDPTQAQAVADPDPRLLNASTRIESPAASQEDKPEQIQIATRSEFSSLPVDRASNEFLKTLGSQIRQSKPFKLEIHSRLYWNGHSVEIPGQYAQLGRGTNQFRIDLKTGEGDATQALSKICDGRFLYSMKWQGGKKTLEFVDLRRIDETRISTGLDRPDNPTNWIATGGLASLLDNLADAFQFTSPQHVVQNGVEYSRLDAIWDTRLLKDLLQDTVPAHYLEPHIVWRKLPAHIPHQVRLFLVHSPSFGWLPHQISFYRMPKGTEGMTSGTIADPLEWELLADIRLFKPQALDGESLNFLQLEAEDIETIDNTPQYITQMRQFQVHREAKLDELEPASKLR